MNSVIYGQISTVIGLIILCGLSQTHAKQYYKWVDANGVTTYSATPPSMQRSNEPQLAPQSRENNQNKPMSGTFKSNATIADEYYNPYKQNGKHAEKKVTTEKENTLKLRKRESPQIVAHNTTSSKKQSFVVKNCNGVRCNDHKGNNYNKVTGNTYLSSRGGVCQMNGTRMDCNK